MRNLLIKIASALLRLYDRLGLSLLGSKFEPLLAPVIDKFLDAPCYPEFLYTEIWGLNDYEQTVEREALADTLARRGYSASSDDDIETMRSVKDSNLNSYGSIVGITTQEACESLLSVFSDLSTRTTIE